MNFSIQSIYQWYRNTLRNPKYRWWLIIGTLAYVLSPIDVLPDFFPILGQLDDAVLVTLLVAEVSQLLGDRLKSRQSTDDAQAEVASNATVNTDPIDVPSIPIK